MPCAVLRPIINCMRDKIKLCLIVLLACTVLYAEQAETGKYDALVQKVESKIKDAKKVDIDGLKVTNQDGVVTIEGVTKLLGSRVKAGEVAQKTDGVSKVNNQIAVTTGDTQDGDIESEIMNKIEKDLRHTPFDLISVKSNHGFVR